MATMRASTSFFVVLLLFVSCQAFIEDPTLKDVKQVEEGPARSIFHKFVAYHEREYAGNEKEWEKRFNIFHNNMKMISEHNQKESSYKLGLNELADSSHEEVLQRKMGTVTGRHGKKDLPPVPDKDIKEIYNPFPRGVPSHSDCTYKLDAVKYPQKIDWREVGVVAPVRNQGECGADWAYATTTVVESMNAILLGEFIELSDQVQIDCNWRGGGCRSGTVEEGYKWALANGLPRIESYPRAYKSKQHACNMSKVYPVATKAAIFDTYEMIPPGENNLKKAVAVGPTAVAVDATCEDFKFYHSGVYHAKHNGCDAAGETESLSKAMVVVGFNADGDEDGVPYWIVRNSWGEKWGEGGYMKMAMYQGEAGLYGIARMASRPVKDGSTSFHLWSKLPEWAVAARHQLQLNMLDIPKRAEAIKEAQKEAEKDEREHAEEVDKAIKVGMEGFGYRKALMW